MLLEVLFPIGLLIVVAKLLEGVLSRFGLSAGLLTAVPPSFARYALEGVRVRNVLEPEGPIDDVLERMTDHSLTVIPVMAPDSGEFLGTVTSHDVLDLVVLMDEIENELKKMGDVQD